MSSVGIYARLSVEDVDKQGNIDSRSITNQKAMLKDYCEEHGWEIYDTYVDEDVSGMERNRPAFQRMLKDCEEGKIDIVVCKDQSRFARDDVIIKEYLHKLFFVWNVRFIGVSDSVDSTSPDFMDNSSIRGFFNEWYVRDISKKIKSTFESKRKQGKFYRCAPYGYKKDPKDNNHLIPDPETRDVVLYIFESYVNGKSLRMIATELNEEGIPSPTAYKTNIYPNYRSRYTDNVWSSDSLRTILRNEAYIGNCVTGKSSKVSYRDKKKVMNPKDKWVRVEGTHEAIIPIELWEKSRSRGTSSSRASRGMQVIQPLSGKVICGGCGSTMTRHVSYYHRKSTNERVQQCYYRCPNAIKGKGTCHNSKCINFKTLESKVLDVINQAIETYCDMDSISIATMQQDTMVRLEKEHKRIEDRIDKVRKWIDNTYTDKLEGLITPDEYKRFKEKFSRELAELESKLAEIVARIEQLEQHKIDSEYRDMLVSKYKVVKELTRGLVEDFIDTVVVGAVDENGNCELSINLKF